MTPPQSLISDTARPLVEQAEQPTAAPAEAPGWERDRAVRVLDAEMASVRRLLAGAGAWLLACAGGAALVVAAWHGLPVGARAASLVAGALLLLLAASAARMVVREADRVVGAYAWWTRAGDDRGGDGWLVDAVEARAWYVHPRRLVRATLASLALLAPLVFLMAATNEEVRWDRTWPADQSLALGVAFAALALPSWYAALVLARGMARAGSAQGARDPLTRALLRRR